MSQAPSGPDVPPGAAPPDQGEPGRAGAPVVDVEAVAPPNGDAEPADPAETAPAADPTEELPADPAPEGDGTTELVRQLGERTADLQRLQAEYINYKRRVDRDRQVVRDSATAAVLAALLGVLDDVDRARQHGELTGGFKAVADSLDRALGGLGLLRFGEPGERFDPRVHEALMHEHSDAVDGPTAHAILQPGYRVGDRVLRPARVAVSEPPPLAVDHTTDDPVDDAVDHVGVQTGDYKEDGSATAPTDTPSEIPPDTPPDTPAGNAATEPRTDAPKND